MQRELSRPGIVAVSEPPKPAYSLNDIINQPGPERKYTLEQVKSELSRHYFNPKKVSLSIVQQDLSRRAEAILYALESFKDEELRPLESGIWKYANQAAILVAYTAEAFKKAADSIRSDMQLASAGKISVDEVDERALGKESIYERLIERVFALNFIDKKIVALMKSRGISK